MRYFGAVPLHNLDTGVDVAGYVERLIQRDVLSAQSFDVILAPIRQGFSQSGMSGDEMNALSEEARGDVHGAKRLEAE